MRGDVRNTQEYCAVEIAMEVLGGRWKLAVLHLLLEKGTLRFGELRRALPSITQRMLTRQLREMEADDLVVRTVYAEVPPKVEYSLTETGHSLRDIAAQLDTWGRRYLDAHGSPARVRDEPAGADNEEAPARNCRGLSPHA
ncbi:winged helix-turn-helix transcriptional regulator [Streptomyces sp. NPDC101227]|uniref:winged helix-turn-helix transcriptional regulator n=1 Tax=Streptomyces sp. NPDC101227 TaxID=3366136 RepID=UPI003824BCE5